VAAGALVLCLHPLSKHAYLNYAIPAEGAVDGDDRARTPE
jgi:hypothetical protein